MATPLKPLEWACTAPGCGAQLGALAAGDVAMAFAQHAYDTHPSTLRPFERVLVGCACDHGQPGKRICRQCETRIRTYWHLCRDAKATAKHFGVSPIVVRRIRKARDIAPSLAASSRAVRP